jgi:regulator of nucleoside diphosphate kinase
MSATSIPPIVLSARDRDRLEPLARRAIAEGHPVGCFLLAELRRAAICAHDDLPHDAVRLDNWVSYRVDWGWPVESRMLVCPDDYSNRDAQLSVLSPVGAALIGLRARARMPYLGIEGLRHVASAESLDPPVGLMSLLQLPAGRSGAPEYDDDSNDDDPGPAAA